MSLSVNYSQNSNEVLHKCISGAMAVFVVAIVALGHPELRGVSSAVAATRRDRQRVIERVLPGKRRKMFATVPRPL